MPWRVPTSRGCVSGPRCSILFQRRLTRGWRLSNGGDSVQPALCTLQGDRLATVVAALDRSKGAPAGATQPALLGSQAPKSLSNHRRRFVASREQPGDCARPLSTHCPCAETARRLLVVRRLLLQLAACGLRERLRGLRRDKVLGGIWENIYR